MLIADVISLLASFASLILAGLAIWLALHHKREADKINLQTRDLMLEIRSDAKMVTNIAVPEMRAYGDAMRSVVLSGMSEKNAVVEVAPAIAKSIDLDPLQALDTLVVELQQRAGYTPSHRTQMLQYAKLIAEDPRIDIVRAMESIEGLVDIFVQSNQSRSLDHVLALFGDAPYDHPGIVESLLNYYSLIIVGERHDAERHVEKFERAIRAAENLEIQEHSLHALLVQAHFNGDKKEVDRLFRRVGSLDDAKKIAVVEAFERRSDPNNIQRRPDKVAMKLAEKYKTFAEAYSEQIESIA